jgi:8-oxo-dGTP pyrophosphatase MutT (NUDIX family)
MEQDLKASMVVILDDSGRALILKRSSGPQWMPEKWALAGGHIEKGESPKDAAIRETKEETNLDLVHIHELEQRGQVMMYYSTSYSGGVKIDFEHTDWAWASYDELTNYDTTPKLKETVKLALDKMK